MTGSSKSNLKVSENTPATYDNFGSEKKKKKNQYFFCKERLSLRYPHRKNAGLQIVAFTPVNGSLSDPNEVYENYSSLMLRKASRAH